MTPPGPVNNADPMATCPWCGLYDEHQVEQVTLNAETPVTTFLGEPLGGWTISGPDGTEVAIRRCRECSRLWRTEDE